MSDNSIVSLAERANACLVSGQLDEAKSLYSRVCHLDSDNEEYWLTLAALHGETGELDKAIECASKAIELDDTYVEAYLTNAHLLHRAGQNEKAFDSALKAVERDDTFDEAMLFLTGLAGQMKRFADAEHWALRSVELLPANADALLNLANAKFELTKYEEAEAAYKKVLTLNNASQVAILGLAKSIVAQEKYDEAVAILKPLISDSPDNYQAKDILATCLANLEQEDEAITMLNELIKKHPDYVFSYIHMANIAERGGDYLKAINYLNQGLEKTKNPLDVLGNLSRLYLDYGMHQQAIDSCKKAMEIDPSNKPAHMFLTLALTNFVHYEEALEELDTLLLDTPDDPLLQGARANVLERLGRDEEAHHIVTTLIDKNTNSDIIADVYARLCHKFDECDKAVTMIEQVLKKTDIENSYRRGLLFTLGKLQDRLKNYDSAFQLIHEANGMKPYKYDHDNYTNYIDRLLDTKITALIKKPHIVETTNRISPVFIFGMPRSGTSLVEQIITSHPEAAAGGERNEISTLASKLPFMEGIEGSYPECLTQLTPDMINRIRTAFDSFTQGLDSAISIVTDKMPENYQHLVFIRMIFPESRIIHCVRNPVDNCLSCYFQQFSGFHDYAYDLEDLGNHYNEYKRLMNHYRDVDNIPLLEVQYEELVHNTEEITRQMIEYCGLDWNERCLHFYDNKQVVRTASYDQVNKPIYTGSIDKWKRYETQLKPLLDTLNQYE